MANDVQVNLRFSADIQQARMQVEILQQSLQNLMSNSRTNISTSLESDLTKSIRKVAELKTSLEQATSIKTGQLDLSKFNESLKKSNTSIADYAYALYGLGPAGQQAFSELASAINSAEMPLKRSNAVLKDFAQTLKNTVKWQISSSLIHGFVGSYEKAVGYAKDLDRSLNDIRIVSGASADEMAKFAQEANNAAKRLSTTTTDYTKAALIYYQQGLNDNEVKERTDITIKMANAAGESAQTISDQLTAVWNNFYDGSQSLEHYADAMVKLGADTASSSDEIAEGLEKFAAIGNTVGLGFDEAAAALATVTATTRQSADVVGTAFKTLFARIQDLKLGDTLEDGTTLGKYSEALNVVGINIKNSNGELKDMNDIILEMGNKWNTISKDQQVALAQTVAGTRQYTQLIALMENFDFYKENLARAQGADGTLQKQADIYAESWEAAGKRVKASAESIYNVLLDDKFFIKLTDGLAGFLNIINDTIKGIGGLQGAFSLLGGVILKVYQTEISTSLSNFAYNLQTLTKKGRENLFNQAAELKNQTNAALRSYSSDGSNIGAVRADVNVSQAVAQDALIEKQRQLLQNGQSLTESEQRIANLMMQQVKLSGEEAINTAQTLQNSTDQADILERQWTLRVKRGTGQQTEDYDDFKKQFDNFKSYQTQYGAGMRIQQQIEREMSKKSGNEKTKLENITTYVEGLTKELKKSGIEADKLFKALGKIKGDNFEQLNKSLSEFYTEIENLGNAAMDELLGTDGDLSLDKRASLALPENEYERFSTELERLQNLWTKNGSLTVDQAEKMRQLVEQVVEAEKVSAAFGGKIPSIADGIVALGQSIMSVSMLISQIKGMIDVWNNEDMSFGDKLISTFTSLGIVIPMVTSAFSKQKLVQMSNLSVSIASALHLKTLSAAEIAAGLAGEAGAAGTASFGAALWAVLWPIAAVIAAIVALVGAISLIYKAWDEAYNAESIAAEKSNKILQEQSELLEEVKTKYEELHSAIEEYTSSYEILKSMKQGTEDWAKQAENVNKQVTDLITKYPKLSKYITKKNGVLGFNKSDLKEIEWLGQNEIREAEYFQLSAQKQANYDNLREQMANKAKNAYSGKDYVNNIFQKAAMGGGISGLIESAWLDVASKDAYMAQIDNLMENYKSQGEEYLASQEIQDKISILADALNTTDDSLIELIRTDKDITDTNRLLVEQQAQNLFAEGKNYQNSKYKDIIDKRTADIIEEKSIVPEQGENSVTEVRKRLDADNSFDYSEYLKLKFGKAEANNYRVVDAMGGDVTIEKKNENGGWSSIDEKRNDRSKDDVAEEYAKLIAERNAKDEASKIDLAAWNEEFAQLEEKYRKSGITNTEDIEAMVRSSQLSEDGKINLGEVSEETANKIVEAVQKNENNAFNLNQEDINDFINKGGSLGARNQEFSERYQLAQKDVMDVPWEEKDNYYLNKQMVEDTLEVYNSLSEADKRIFAETIDFKQNLNKQAMLDMLKEEKQTRADASLDSAAEQYELDADVLKKQARLLQDNVKGLEDNAEAAAEMAIANQRLNKGVDKLTDGWDDWKKTLKSSDKTTQDYAEACVEVEDAMREMLSLSDDAIIPEGFLESDENLGLLDEIANGSEEAVQKLAFNLTKAQIETQEFTADIAENMHNAFELDDNTDYAATFEGMKTAAINALTEIQSMADGLDIGAGLKDPSKQGELAASLNEYALAAGWTAEQMQSALSSVGVRAKISMIQGKPVTKQIPITKITRSAPISTPYTLPDGSQTFGFTQYEESTIEGYKEVSEPTLVPQIEMEDPENPKGQTKPIFESVSMRNIAPSVTTGGKSKGGGKGGGGGGSSKKPTEPTKVKPTEQKQKKDEVDRYHEIKEVLDDIQSDLDEISNLKDEAFGADKLKAMDNEKKKLLEIVDAQKKYQAEVAKNLNDDKWEASQIGAQFDEQGRITNYQTLQEQWMNEWNVQAATFDAREQDLEIQLAAAKNAENEDLQNQIEKQKEKLSEEREEYDKEYERKKDAISQYEETLNLSEEAKRQLEDYLRQIRQLNYERLEYKLQIRVELNENDLADIEHLLSRLSENDFSKSAERIALISKEAKNYRLMTDDQKNFIEELKAQYAAGEINQEQFIEGMKKAKEAVLEAETSIREGIVTIGDELRNAFSNAADDLDKTYEKMQRRLNFGDFYKEISQVINGEPDYDILNSIIDSQSTLTQARVDGRLREREALIVKQQELYNKYNQATSEETKAQIRETLDQVESRIADTNSEIQSDIQALADYAQEKFTNAIEKISKKWQEKNFGDSLDNILDEVDLRNRAQEELLTTTNKVYETNKLIRQAEKDIDATTNKRAKQAYQEYIAKAKQKQEQNELTQLELDLLTAEYEITKAQIALEEAQNAKDTVRLTRNSEGNFGYVYTANQDKVTDAQQALEDATNSYYNIALDGAKSASQQIYALEQEWQEKVKEIYADTTLSAEEKSEKVQEITDYYYTMIEQQRDKYYIATDAMRESSYEHEVDYNHKSIKSAENWFNNHDELITKLKRAQRTYQTEIEDVSKNVEKAYGNQKDAVKYIDDATKVYSGDLDTLIPKIETDLTNAVNAATLAWDEYAKKLREVIELSNQIMGETQETLMRETYKDDYQARIDELLAMGYTENSPEVQMLKRFRKEKISATDWYGMAQDAIRNGKSFDEVSWIAKIRDEKSGGNDSYDLIKEYYDKFSQDYFGDLQNLVTNGYTLNSEEIKGLIALRDWKLGELGKKATTLEDLKKWMTEKGISFASGGYTGDWGPNGRLAILHEKELVLNSDDTKNILTSVGIIREISKALDNSAVWAMFGQTSLNAATVGASADSTLQQEVTIHADFPNVTDHNEIELAIDNLINAASQYAYRT